MVLLGFEQELNEIENGLIENGLIENGNRNLTF